MTYKIGEKVLVEMEIDEVRFDGTIGVISNALGFSAILTDNSRIRPFTPRQEFEYGEEVEVFDSDCGGWYKAKFMCKDNKTDLPHKFYAESSLDGVNYWYKQCRKPQPAKPRDTITIGNTTYDKSEKDLKPIKGDV